MFLHQNCLLLGSDIISGTGGPLRIISRSEWIAQPPEHDLAKLELPATRVIVAHTATENCTTQVFQKCPSIHQQQFFHLVFIHFTGNVHVSGSSYSNFSHRITWLG